MKDDNKIIAQNTIILYIRMIFVMFVSLFTSRIILNRLGVTDFGIFNVIGGLVVIFGFVNQALTNATQRFITFNLAKGDIVVSNKIFNLTLYLHFLIGICVFFLGESLGQYFLHTTMVIPDERIQASSLVLSFSLCSSFISITLVPFNAEIIAHEDMKVYASISIFEAVFKLLFVLSLYFFESHLLIIFSLLVLVNQIIVALLTIVFCNKKYEEVFLRFYKDFSFGKEIFSFSFWSLCGNIAWVLTTHGTNVLLNVFFNPAVNAARGISVQVQSAVSYFANSFNVAINPQITKNYSLEKLQRVHQLLLFSSRVSFFLLIIPSIPIFFEADYILKLWLGIVPEHTSNFVRLTLILILLESIGSPFNTAIFATGNIKYYHLTVGCCNLLNIPISYTVFKYFKLEPEFAYVVIIATTLVCQFFRLQFIKFYLKLDLLIFTKCVYIPCIIVLFSSFFFMKFLCEYIICNSFMNIFNGIILTSVCVFILGLNMRERNYIINLVKVRILHI